MSVLKPLQVLNQVTSIKNTNTTDEIKHSSLKSEFVCCQSQLLKIKHLSSSFAVHLISLRYPVVFIPCRNNFN